MEKKTSSLSPLFCGKSFPIVTATLSAMCVLVFLVELLWPPLFEKLCFETWPTAPWQLVTGIFAHNPEVWIHLPLNLLGLLPLGIVVEKQFGSGKTAILFLTEWLVTAVLFQWLTAKHPGQAAGISSICYAFATVAFACVVRVVRLEKRRIFRQPLFYYFLFEGFGMLSMLNPLLGSLSLSLHLSGVAVGVLFLLCFFRKKA